MWVRDVEGRATNLRAFHQVYVEENEDFGIHDEPRYVVKAADLSQSYVDVVLLKGDKKECEAYCDAIINSLGTGERLAYVGN